MNSQTNLNDSSEANLHAVDYWQVLRNRYGIIILATLLIFTTAAIITYVIPKKYKSTSKIAIYAPQDGLDPTNNIGGKAFNGALLSRNYMETQYELIRSELTLGHVVEALGLSSQWDIEADRAVSILKSILRIEPVKGTDLLNITVEHKDQAECQQIAQAVALAYKKQRESEEQQRVDEQLATLDSVLQEQEDKVQEKRNLLNTILQTLNMTYVDGSGRNENFGERSSSLLSKASYELEEFKKSQRSLKSQIDTLTGKTDDNLISTAAGLNIVQSRVPRLYEQYVNNNRNLIAFETSGYGAKHPRMIAAMKTNVKLNDDLHEAVDELRETLRSRLELTEANIKSQEEVVAEYETKAVDQSISSHDYDDARTSYELEKGLFETMKLKHTSQRIKIKMPKSTMKVYEEAKKPQTHSFPNTKMNLAIGAILGLIVGVGLAFFLEFMDTSVKSLDDVERYLQVPVLAVIPKDISILHKQGGNTPDAEAYRILRTNIEFNRRSQDSNCITVVSGGAGEGKSTTLVNLAFVCAQGGYSTLIIDADLRRPRMHTFFDINNSIGLTNYLTTDLSLEEVILQTRVENLYFMPSGIVPQDAAGILNSNRMSALIEDVKQKFDLILIDSPPIFGVSDAAVISSEADQTMIVIQHRKLPRNMLMRVKQAVENVGGDIIGVVLNNVDVKSDNQYQYYTSYYTYYSPDSDASAALPNQPKMKRDLPKDEVAQKPELKVLPSSSSNEDSLY